MAIYKDYQTISTTVSDVDSVNNAIKNILLTPKGSMPGKPTFGSQINKLMFEMDDAKIQNLIYVYVVDAVAKWEQRIVITNVDYNSVPQYNKQIATIYYSFVDSKIQANSQVTVSFNTVG
jgi:phage baseplate assembly protein W